MVASSLRISLIMEHYPTFAGGNTLNKFMGQQGCGKKLLLLNQRRTILLTFILVHTQMNCGAGGHVFKYIFIFFFKLFCEIRQHWMKHH